MTTHTSAYAAAMGAAVLAGLFQIWLTLAAGIVGVEGDRFDLIYIGVLALGLTSALVVRFRAAGMARVLFAMALAQAGIAGVALMLGKHLSPVSPVLEILGLNAMFAVLFGAAAFLFLHAARQRVTGARSLSRSG